MIDIIIQKLKDFAKEDFPVKEVSSFLKSIELKNKDIKKYTFKLQNRYTRNLIYKDINFELLLLCWAPNVTAPIHGHEGEKCWAKVLDGELEICNYKESGSYIKLIKKVSCKPGYLDGPADIHSVKNLETSFATSLHIYAKPYDACDIYSSDLKTIERVKLGYYSVNGMLR